MDVWRIRYCVRVVVIEWYVCGRAILFELPVTIVMKLKFGRFQTNVKSGKW